MFRTAQRAPVLLLATFLTVAALLVPAAVAEAQAAVDAMGLGITVTEPAPRRTYSFPR